MKSSPKLLLCSVALLGLAGAGDAPAQIILNGNFSANASAYTSTNGREPQNVPITNWSQFSGANGFGLNGTDTNGGGASHFTVFGPATQPASGDFVFLVSNANPTGPNGEPAVYQNITLSPNTTYTLTYSIGERQNDGTGGIGLLTIVDGAFTGTSGNGGTAQTAAGSGFTVLTTQSVTPLTTAFSAETDTFTTPATLTGTSQSIVLQNGSSGTTTGTPNGNLTIDYTNLVLTANAAGVPEPSTVVGVIGAFGLVLWSVVRRRRLVA